MRDRATGAQRVSKVLQTSRNRLRVKEFVSGSLNSLNFNEKLMSSQAVYDPNSFPYLVLNAQMHFDW